jgi:[ribosomal protein S5]-alanine N-acetyltransferase
MSASRRVPQPCWEHGLMSVTRLVTQDDAEILAEALRANREFLSPWEPVRGEEYFTAAGQRAAIADALARHDQGTALPHVITGDSGKVVGRITLNSIVRGPFLSCSVGYWVSAAENGRGLATTALREIAGLAFGEIGLHRIQAETLRNNVASQRVLQRNGFVRIGLAPTYLKIAGKWQDCVLYQLINEAMGLCRAAAGPGVAVGPLGGGWGSGRWPGIGCARPAAPRAVRPRWRPRRDTRRP